MIDTRAQAEELVSYVRYPPDGVRSMGPTRANFSAGANYGAEADGQMLCFAMIETRQGFDNLEAIASTPGLDGLYIGPSDLTIGLVGRSLRIGLDREELEMVEAIQRIVAVAHAAGIHAALHCGSPAYAAKAAGWGFDLVTVGTDARLLSAAAGACVTQTRDLIG
jgi:4-hydroxy-2-oxoheptanedioate aldolase